MMPKVTVLMPVYNGEKYLREAIDSILNQTFTDFEFLIIDDGSTDDSLKIIEFYSNKDSRIKTVINDQNKGIVFSLNRGIKLTKSKYIARMDADDIAFPDRFNKQVEFLENHNKISILGTNMLIIDQDLKILSKTCVPTHSEVITWNLLFLNVIAHPTVMIRNTFFQEIGNYSFSFPHVEDYELWLRAKDKYQFANLSEPLLYYRNHNYNIGNIYQNSQQDSALSLSCLYISQLLKEPINSKDVEMLKFCSDNTNCLNSYLLLNKVYGAFCIKCDNSNVIQDLIKKDMYGKAIGLIRRDKNLLRKIKVLNILLQSDFFTFISVISDKIFKNAKKLLLNQ
jgi:glycosyltransferase involved in cell wall biosynthesis